MEEAQKLAQKFQISSQQMQPPQIMQQQSMPIMNNMNNYNLGQYQQFQQYPPTQQPIYSANNYQPEAQTQNDEIKKQQYSSYLQNLIQQKNEIMKNDPTNPALQVVIKQIADFQQKLNYKNDENQNNNNEYSQIQQISQEMTNLFTQNDTQNTNNNKYTWI